MIKWLNSILFKLWQKITNYFVLTNSRLDAAVKQSMDCFQMLTNILAKLKIIC